MIRRDSIHANPRSSKIGRRPEIFRGSQQNRVSNSEEPPRAVELGLYFGLKAGVNLKAVFMPIKIGFMEISRSRFKQSKFSLLKTESNDVGCFVNF